MSQTLTSVSQAIYDFAVNLLQSSGYAGVFVLMVMESATLPIPSEVVLPFAGYYLVFKDQLDFWLIVVVASVGSLVGTLIDYGIGYYLGRAAILRYGRVVRLNEGHLELSEKWFSKYGNIAVLLARFVPLVRTLIAFPAGIAEMKLPKFLAYSVVGIFVWDAVLTYIGFVAGQNINSIDNTLQRYFIPIGLLAILVLAVIVFLFTRRKGNRQSQEAPH